MAQLERGTLSMSLPAVRLRTPLSTGFSEKFYISPLSILRHCFDIVSLGKALHPQMIHWTQVKKSTWWDRDGNVYDISNAPKWLQDSMLSVELIWHTNEQV